jgi:spore coat polysaccharide biosynthesis protein SpsF
MARIQETVTMKTVAIIRARMTSTRMPGKVLRPILGKPMLEHLIERLRVARTLDEIWVATTSNATDDATAELARGLGVSCFRGSETDVLDRVLQTARAARADVIVEVTGDCPLIDPGVVDRLVEVYRANEFDHVSNILNRTYPVGLDTQVFSTGLLGRVACLTNDPIDREHVSIYIYEHPELFRLCNIESNLPHQEEVGKLRLTVDTPEDFDLISAVYEELYPRNARFLLADVLDLLSRRPELLEFNRHIEAKRYR